MADEDLVLESLHTRGGVKTGVLVRRVSPTSLATLTCFTEPGLLHHVENRVEFDSDDPFSWTHYVHHDGETFLEREHEASDPGDTVPSHAEWLLVHRLLQSGDREVAFTRLDEETGETAPAILVHEADEVVLYVDGRATNRHRVVGDEVLASDWGGIGSRPVAEMAELVEGLDNQVAVRLRNFVDS